MNNLFDQILEATSAVRARWAGKPVVGIILGTGLGAFAEEIADRTEIRYEEIPHFPRSTAPSHKGQFVCGTLGGKTVVAMEGRFHAYEGYTMQQITFPVRVMKALGCEVLIATNACGGMNPQYSRGDIMLMEDHINLLGDNPLIGPNDDRLGERFPDMSVYNRLIDEEWNVTPGDVKYCGGDVMLRSAALQQAGGYRATLIAGEEPELCVRLRQRGCVYG